MQGLTAFWMAARAATVLLLASFVSHSPAFSASADKLDSLQARTVSIRVVKAQGLFPKILSVRGKIGGETTERELAHFVYGGLGPNASNFPTDWITFQNVETVRLQMDITILYQTPETRPVMWSDDPATSGYLFQRIAEEWRQRPFNTVLDVFDGASCQIVDQSWEDGGGFDTQDFFFQVRHGDCAAIALAD